MLRTYGGAVGELAKVAQVVSSFNEVCLHVAAHCMFFYGTGA